MKLVVLCGGSGTRLWPISRKSTPKQFAKLINDKSLFELTLERNSNLCNEILIIVNENQLNLCESQIPTELKSKTQIIIEPVGRNTAPAICMAALAAGDEEILVVASDHLINDLDIYTSCIEQAKNLAKESRLVTFGINPTYPETGYGYIEFQNTDVKSFKEKPDADTAKMYLESQNYLWNSGMFCFNARFALEQYQELAPEILVQSKKCFEAARKEDNRTYLKLEDMNSIPSDSIDYALMEKANCVSVVKSDFSWNDLGSYDALYDILDKDDHGNCLSKDSFSLNSKNNLILSESKTIATFDVEDLIIVETKDAIMVGKRGESQRVKELYQIIKDKKPELLE